MGVGHGRSRSANLSFHVFDRPVHPEWFSVRQHRRLTLQGWEADLRVIEGGHAVAFRCGRVWLTEILSGPQTELPGLGCLFRSRVRHERMASLQPGLSVEYQTSFEVERVDPEVFSHLSEEMMLDASPGRIFHRFAPENRLAPAPIVHMRFEARARGLTVHAFHTYPEEWAIVRTQTLFEPR